MLKAKNDINQILDLATALQEIGTANEIVSVFDDGGYRELIMGKLFGLDLHKGRHGDDATDEQGFNYELKTVNLVNTSGKLRKNPGITTCHHVNHDIIKRYRNLHSWIIGIFFINEPVEIYELDPQYLAYTLDQWEKRLNNEPITHLNNPKLKLADVRSSGILHYKNEVLAAKYIDGTLPKGTLVYRDDITLGRPDVKLAK